MRNDHVERIAARYPTPAEMDAIMARAKRLRSEAVHDYLTRFARWLVRPLRSRSNGKTRHSGACHA